MLRMESMLIPPWTMNPYLFKMQLSSSMRMFLVKSLAKSRLSSIPMRRILRMTSSISETAA